MEVVLLGTGSADGWPNAFCACESCRDASRRGLVRTPTSVLVDGVLLLDCGPETPRQSVRAGVGLGGVEAIAVTHAHHDHLDPAFLLYRSWVTQSPIRVIGPEPVIAACRDWVAPQDSLVDFVEVSAGTTVAAGAHRVTALPAAHHAFGEAVLYLVEGSDARLLYATDTGPLPRATLAALAGLPLDLVLLEETFGDADLMSESHLNLETFAAALEDLRAVGAITAATRLVAVHLSHHNPVDLDDRLAALGALAGVDGCGLVVGALTDRGSDPSSSGPPHFEP